jgi:hypothetical protein
MLLLSLSLLTAACRVVALCTRRLHEPAVVLLLYSLLHDDSNFLGFVLSRTDLESLVCVSHSWRSRWFC